MYRNKKDEHFCRYFNKSFEFLFALDTEVS